MDFSKISIAFLVALVCASIAGGYLYFSESVLFNLQTMVGIFLCTLCLSIGIMVDSGKKVSQKRRDIYRLIV